MDAVDAAIESILDPSIRGGFSRNRRRAPQVYSRSIAGFPFDVISLQIDDEVSIIADGHERRLPGYWEHRVGR